MNLNPIVLILMVNTQTFYLTYFLGTPFLFGFIILHSPDFIPGLQAAAFKFL